MILETESDEEMRELAKMEREEAESLIEDLEQKNKNFSTSKRWRWW